MLHLPIEIRSITLSFLLPDEVMRYTLCAKSTLQSTRQNAQISEASEGLTQVCKKSIKIQQFYSRIYHSCLLKTPVGTVTFGKNHVVICNESQAFAKGSNHDYQLGLPRKRNYITFTQVPIDKKIVQCRTGLWHTLFLTEEHRVYSCGKNRFNQLARRTGSIHESIKKVEHLRCSAIHAADNYSIMLLLDKTVVGFGKSKSQCVKRGRTRAHLPHPRQNQAPSGLANIKNIGGNRDCVLVQNENNEIYAWGKLRATKKITDKPVYLDTIAV